jgi:hypothetical protein
MFFSVKATTKIAGKVYTPCVCYALPDVLRATIDKMVAEDRAYIYDHKVFFQNGKVIEKKEEAKPVVAEKKKAKKDKTVTVRNVKELAEEAEIIPSPEEIADNVEDF